MPAASVAESSNLLLCARPWPDREAEAAAWRVDYQAAVLAAPGAGSFQYWPPTPDQDEGVVVVRFDTAQDLRAWRHSPRNLELVAAIAPLVQGGHVLQLAGQAAAEYYGSASTSEIIITQIKPGEEAAYRAFADRIQAVQQTFPGYLGSFVQPPHQKESGWTTVLRFDTPEHMEGWLSSAERAALLKESEPLILGFQAQRVDTSFPGWMPVNPVTGKSPNRWKTASLVLLTLFPVVMLELKFLSPHLRALNPAFATYIGNAISVAVTTWPLMPIAIKLFHPWIFEEEGKPWLVSVMPLVLVLCYAVEIALLWKLL